jgi:hypothetical protein
MKEQFDKKLAEKIKASFENHQEAYNPKEWDKLSATYFAKPKGAILPFWMYWAASLVAIAFVASIVLFNTDDKENLYTSETEVELKEENTQDTIQSQQPQNEDKNIALSEKPKKTQKAITSTQSRASVSKNTAQKQNNAPNEVTTFDKLDTGTKTVAEVAINTEMEATKPEIDKSIVLELRKKEEQEALEKINTWLADGESSPSKIEEKEDIVQDPLKLGVLLMPQSTTNSTQAVNIGAGIISELSVSSKFKLDFGIAYARQTLTPGINIASNNYVSDALSNSERSALMSSNFVTTSNELSFGQLEIPFNLKYKVFDTKKSDFYLISGVSNMLYINQRNTVTYNSVNIASSGFADSRATLTTTSQTFTPETQNNSRNTNIGQLLNLSVGFEQNLSNGTFLSIEPFYKLSLGNQTFINQQFSIGGLNLRLNFLVKDKKD